MARRRWYYRRNRRRGKRTTARKFVNRIVKAVLHRQLENKYYDQALALTAVDYSGVIYNLYNGLAAGTGGGASGRVGIKINPVSLSVNFLVRGNATSTIYQTMRVVIVRARKEQAVPPTPADILQGIGAADSYMTPYNFESTDIGRFKVLYDKTFAVGSGIIQTNTSASAYHSNLPEQINRHLMFWKNAKHKVTYTSGANTVEDGGVYIMCISDSAINGPYIDGYVRLTYEDA